MKEKVKVKEMGKQTGVERRREDGGGGNDKGYGEEEGKVKEVEDYKGRTDNNIPI